MPDSRFNVKGRITMWVEPTKTGKFKFVEQYTDPRTQKKRRVSITLDKNTTHTKKLAQQRLTKKIEERLNQINTGVIKQGITWEKAIDEWEIEYKKQIRVSSFANFERSLKPRTVALFPKNQLVSKINSKQLIKIYNQLLYSEDLSNGTVQAIKGKVNQILQYCYLHDYIAQIPINLKINWKRDNDTKVEEKFLDDDEYTMVLKGLKRSHRAYRLALEFQYWTGARIGEVAVLRPKDFYQRNGIWFVFISGTLIYAGLKAKDYYRNPQPKTADGEREIPLSKRALEIYKELSDGKKENDFLFIYNNHLISPISISQTLTRIKKRLHLKKKLSTHTFRHTYVSKLAEEGYPLSYIQERVGHKDGEITRNVYLHVTKSTRNKYDKLASNR